MAPLVAVSFALVACSRSLYDFPDINPSLKANQVNLIVDSSFEDPSVQFCVSNCRTSSGWSVEHTTALPPKYEQTKNGAVAGTYAEAFSYVGQPGDDGVGKSIELYNVAVGPTTKGGYRLTFTLWVSGTCVKCAPIIGIEAFDKGNHYLGETDQYFDPPETPRAVQVSYDLPKGTVIAASFLQVPEIYSVSSVNLFVDNASLVSTAR